MGDLGQLLEKVRSYADLAVHHDSQGNREAALFYYTETAVLIDSAFQAGGSGLAGVPEASALKAKAGDYRKRAEDLQALLVATPSPSGGRNNDEEEQKESDLERAYFLLTEGLDADEEGQTKEALELYTEAVELCIKAKKASSNEAVQKKLATVASQALDRAEKLKTVEKGGGGPTTARAPANMRPLRPAFDLLHVGEVSAASGAVGGAAGGALGGATARHLAQASGGGLTDEEKKVLAVTSMINGREYVPFTTGDLKEKFAFPVPFTDKHGKLSLAPKQSSKLVKWARPDEFIPNPSVIQHVDCYSVKQTVVSDCSFVASIAISAQYEKRFGKKLITSLIYPQNRNRDPVFNPCGKYMVKLRVNGVSRKVVIDDYFPLGARGELLCSYSSNKSELWISLLEKAYMKVMGGYDFPGSNSNIDLYALTGWIPERATLKTKDDSSFNRDQVFRKLWQRFHQGDVLATVATGEMSESAAERAGLVPTHAYALLDVREVNGVRLFLLKNPWSHLRWKGNYSEFDSRHWTPQMKTALKYEPKDAQNFDNGVFWIDYDSLCQFFDVLYMNWNPELFKHTFAMHNMWKAGVGPSKDMYTIASNPQYSLELKESPGAGAGIVWILLSRHITDIADFKNNKEYITLLVYTGNGGKKVYYPYDPPPYIDGIRINSPHYLCKIDLGPGSPSKFTLVVSQYEKTATIYYTIKVYATLPFELKKLVDPYKHRQEITGKWTAKTAGGCGNYRESYPTNPRYQFTVDRDCHLLVELKGPKQYQIGFDIVLIHNSSSEVDKTSPKFFKLKQSGPYRSGYVVLTLEVLAGTYDIVPTTFRPGQLSAFFLTVQSSVPLKLNQVQ